MPSNPTAGDAGAPYSDEEIAWLRYINEGGPAVKRPDSLGVMASHDVRWLATIDALLAERRETRAEVEVLRDERDLLARVVQACDRVMGGHMIGINCHGPCLTKEEIADLVLVRAHLTPRATGAP